MTLPDKAPSSLAMVADPALEALLRLAHLVAGLPNPGQVLAALVSTAVRHLGAAAAAALRLEQSTAVVEAAEGEALEGWQREVEVLDRSVGELLHQACERRYGRVHTLPLVSDADLFGALVLFFERPEQLEPRELRLARALAELAATALAKAARYQELERALAERDAAQGKLRATVEHLQALIDTAGSVILFLSPEGEVLELNRAGEQVHGCLREEALGEGYVERFVAPEQRDSVRESLDRVLGGATTRAYESDVVAADGTRRTLLWNADRLVGESGRTAGIVAVGQDITERKQLEEELLQAQKMEALGRLASGVAHDFNNVLMGITGMADVALAQLDEASELRPFIEDIKDSGMRGATLTRQLMAFVRRRPKAAQVVDLHEVVRRSVPLIEQVLNRNVELSVELDAEDARAVVDAGQLEQALLNLAINACDAMAEGGKLTIATASPMESDRRWLALAVSDTGHGIDASVVKRIFEPFFTTKAEGRGTGLGLSQVRTIVEQAGGRVEVESSPGAGTLFRLWLPHSDRTVDPSYAERPAPPRARNQMVLLVEDDQLVRMSMRHWLEDGGYRVLTVDRGEEAIELLGREPIEALVTDIRLPGMSGFELAQRARRMAPSLPLLYVSAHADHSDDPARLGDVPLLVKPFAREALLRALARLVARRSRQGKDQRPEPPPISEPRRTTILVVDDEGASRSALRLLLSERHDVVDVGSGSEAVASLAALEPDLLLTDIGLPGMQVGELVAAVRARFPRVHVIYMSGRGRHDAQVVAALNVPDARFVAKPIDIDALFAMIEEVLAKRS